MADKKKERGYWSGQMRPVYEAFVKKEKRAPTASEMLPKMAKELPIEAMWTDEKNKDEATKKLNSFIQSVKPKGEKKTRGKKGTKFARPLAGNPIFLEALKARIDAMDTQEFVEFCRAFNAS